jgi:hypothetical protein
MSGIQSSPVGRKVTNRYSFAHIVSTKSNYLYMIPNFIHYNIINNHSTFINYLSIQQ